MRKSFLFLAIFFVLDTNAQNYLISFAGTGESSTVSSVIVQNLRTNSTLALNGDDILQLTLVTKVESADNEKAPVLKIYPNPVYYNSIFQINPPVKGDAIISVIDINGKTLLKVQCFLEAALQEFDLTGLNSGIYLVNVKGPGYQYSQKLLSYCKSKGKIFLNKLGNNQQIIDKIS